MSTQFAQDLRLARKKSGFTQGDVAHLLAAQQSIVSDLEQSKIPPNLEQIVELSLIYGRSFESFFAEVMDRCRQHLTIRLETLTAPSKQTAHTFSRPGSLARLKRRLAETPDYGGA
jgi:transcriptional regulator with XRE-family HTH domain